MITKSLNFIFINYKTLSYTLVIKLNSSYKQAPLYFKLTYN